MKQANNSDHVNWGKKRVKITQKKQHKQTKKGRKFVFVLGHSVWSILWIWNLKKTIKKQVEQKKKLQANDGSFFKWKMNKSAKPDYYQLLNELLSTTTITTNNNNNKNYIMNIVKNFNLCCLFLKSIIAIKKIINIVMNNKKTTDRRTNNKEKRKKWRKTQKI